MSSRMPHAWKPFSGNLRTRESCWDPTNSMSRFQLRVGWKDFELSKSCVPPWAIVVEAATWGTNPWVRVAVVWVAVVLIGITLVVLIYVTIKEVIQRRKGEG